MTKSGIEWTDRSDWNPMRGCTRVSEGCRNCYAERIAGRFSAPGQPFHGFATQTPNGGRWTGKVEMIPDRLDLPLRWQKPSRIFVNSAFDLFHESVPDEWIDRVFAIMAAAHWHTFQVLTKRADRMARYLADGGHAAAQRWVDASWKLAATIPALKHVGWSWAGEDMPWPLPNIWLGVSAEDQKRADERIPHLLATPAAVRWVSAEPLLGPIWMATNGRFDDGDGAYNWLTGDRFDVDVDANGVTGGSHKGPRLDWVITGGESGPGARPMHPEWARSLRDQCAAAGVPFMFKQWGGWHPMGQTLANGHVSALDRGERPGEHHSWCGGEFSTLVGKGRAGRLLDGVEHNGMPSATP